MYRIVAFVAATTEMEKIVPMATGALKV